MTTCLVDEEEMKKLLRERGHMLENHVERLWAYLTIQELLAKRYQPIGCLGEWGHNHPRAPPPATPGSLNYEGVVLSLEACEQVRFTVL